MPKKRNMSDIYAAMGNVNVGRKEDASKKKSYEIEGLFKPKMGPDGKFTVVMRFLPAHPDEDIPWVENRNHMFQLDNGAWFGCDCLKKWNKPCPICDYNSKVWEKYGRTDEARAKVKAKWKPHYYSNVYIVKNPTATETEGKVYRFEYGRAIMKFIQDAMADKDDAELGLIPGINPFSWWGPNDKAVLAGEDKAGANFVFEGVRGPNGPNYDNSHFSNPRRISKLGADGKMKEMTDAEIDVIESQLYTLKDIEKQESEARSYKDVLDFYKKKSGGEDLMEEFSDGNTEYEATVNTVPKASAIVESDDDEMFAGTPLETKKPTVETATMPFDEDEDTGASVSSSTEETSDDDDDFFARLANG